MRKLIFLLFTLCVIVQAKAFENPDSCDCARQSALTWKQRAHDLSTTRIVTTFSIKIALKLGITPALKDIFKEERPDNSSFNSFPSRHATWAYGIAGTITYQLGPSSPWWAIGSMTLANGVGFQRILAHRHYPHDIMGGMALGLSTDLMAKVIANWIFGRYDFFPCWRQSENLFLPTLSMSTGMSFPLNRSFGEYYLQNSLESTLRFSMPLSTLYGFTASASMNSGYVELPNQYLEPLTSISLLAGVQAHWQLANGPCAVSAFAEGGYRRYIPNTLLKGEVGTSAFMVRAGLESSIMLTRKLALALEVAYGYSTLSISHTRRNVSSISSAIICKANF